MTSLPTARVAVVVGTRPELIKTREIVRILGSAATMIHTGQHHDKPMWHDLLEDLRLPLPSTSLTWISLRDRWAQIAASQELVSKVLSRERSLLAVLVQGDTNSTVAGALAAANCGLPLVHVEAGLRSFDLRMPEEVNRILVDHLADLCCAPSVTGVANMRREGISSAKIVHTGNTIVETAQALLPSDSRRREILESLRIGPGGFILATFHRPENADNGETIAEILADLRRLPLPVVLPLHPRIRARLHSDLRGIRVVAPLTPRTFLALFFEAALTISDSGGVQEEATVLGRPVLVVRRSTERPETLGKWCQLVTPGQHMRNAVEERLQDVEGLRLRLAAVESPYGDGSASERIVAELLDRFG